MSQDTIQQIVSIALQIGGVLVVGLLVQARVWLKEWKNAQIAKLEAERDIIVSQEARAVLDRIIDVAVGAVAEWVRSKQKDGKILGPISGPEKLQQAKDTVVALLSAEGKTLTDYNLSADDVRDLIHGQLTKLRSEQHSE